MNGMKKLALGVVIILALILVGTIIWDGAFLSTQYDISAYSGGLGQAIR